MPNARGDEAKLFARQQAAFGTAESAGDGAFMALPFYSYGVVPSEDRSEDELMYGDAYPGESVRGLQSVAGAMVVPVGLNSIGWHLRSILGAPATTGSSDYTHVFTAAAQPTTPILTHGITHTRIGTHFVQDSLTCMSLEMALRKDGQRARATLNMIGRQQEKTGAALDASPVAYAPDPVPVGFQGQIKRGGSVAADVTGADFTLTSGVGLDQETMNLAPTAAGFESPRWGLTGSITARYRDNTWYDAATDDTPIALTLELVRTATQSLVIAMPDVRFQRTSPEIDGRGPISTQFSFQAVRPASGAELVTFTLKNQTADYANPT